MGTFANGSTGSPYRAESRDCVTSYFVEKTSTFIIPIYNQQSYALKKQIFKLRSFYDTLFLSKRQTELV
jgi:hypothetical protein